MSLEKPPSPEIGAILRGLMNHSVHLVSHGSRTLLQHLWGTYQVLHSWDSSDDVCLAGLTHSVYGTQFFKNASVPISRRQELKELIGHQAEHWAYLFCALDRNAILAADQDSSRLFEFENRFESKLEQISSDDLRALSTIAVANEFEQLKFSGDFEPNRWKILCDAKTHLSPLARSRIDDHLQACKRAKIDR